MGGWRCEGTVQRLWFICRDLGIGLFVRLLVSCGIRDYINVRSAL